MARARAIGDRHRARTAEQTRERRPGGKYLPESAGVIAARTRCEECSFRFLNGEGEPPAEESQSAERRDRAKPANVREREDVQGPAEDDNSHHEKPPAEA